MGEFDPAGTGHTEVAQSSMRVTVRKPTLRRADTSCMSLHTFDSDINDDFITPEFTDHMIENQLSVMTIDTDNPDPELNGVVKKPRKNKRGRKGKRTRRRRRKKRIGSRQPEETCYEI